MLDRLSPMPTLKSKTSGRFKSLLGGLLTLLVYFLVGARAIISLKQYLKTKIINHQKFEENFSPLDLDKVQPFWKSGMVPILVPYYHKEDFNQFDAYGYSEIQFFVNRTMPFIERTKLSIRSSMVECRKLSEAELIDTYGLKPTLKWDSMCVNKSDVDSKLISRNEQRRRENLPELTLKGDYDIKLFPCDPARSERCKNAAKEVRDFHGLFTKLHFRLCRLVVETDEMEADYSKVIDKLAVIQDFFMNGRCSLNIWRYKFTEIVNKIDPYDFWLKLNVKPIDGFWGFNNLKESQRSLPTQRICNESDRDIPSKYKECSPYIEIWMGNFFDPIKFQIIREYHSISNTLSSIGGFYTAIWLIFSFSYNQIFNRLLRPVNTILALQVFGITPPKKKCCRKKSRKTDEETSKFKAAVSIVQDALDVNNLVKQLCVLKLLAAFMITPQCQELVLKYTVNQTIREMEDEKEKKKEKKKKKKKKASSKNDDSMTEPMGNISLVDDDQSLDLGDSKDRPQTDELANAEASIEIPPQSGTAFLSELRAATTDFVRTATDDPADQELIGQSIDIKSPTPEPN